MQDGNNMRQNLEVLKQQIDEVDSEIIYAESWLFSTNRKNLFLPMLQRNILAINKPNGADEFHSKMKEILSFLDERFYANTWPLHDVHFHKNFEEYVYCPYTCLNEISECLEKILKEYFCA